VCFFTPIVAVSNIAIGGMAARPETVEALTKRGVPPERAEATTRYLMEKRLIRRSKRGRRGLERLDYNADEFAIIMIGLGSYLPIHAPLIVNELTDHVPTRDGPLWQHTAGDSFESLLAPLSDHTTLRDWLGATFLRFASLTPEKRRWWIENKTARTAFLEFSVDPDISTTVGSARARFEWGSVNNRKSQKFRSLVPSSWEEILSLGKPNYQIAIISKLSFPLLLVPGDLLAQSISGRAPHTGGTSSTSAPEDETAAALPGVAAATRDQNRDSGPEASSTSKATSRRGSGHSPKSQRSRPG
jgi:hypothetical protein